MIPISRSRSRLSLPTWRFSSTRPLAAKTSTLVSPMLRVSAKYVVPSEASYIPLAILTTLTREYVSSPPVFRFHQYKLTKVITLSPRFMFKNNLSTTINFRQEASDSFVHLAPGERAPLHRFVKRSGDPRIVLAHQGSNQTW